MEKKEVDIRRIKMQDNIQAWKFQNEIYYFLQLLYIMKKNKRKSEIWKNEILQKAILKLNKEGKGA